MVLQIVRGLFQSHKVGHACIGFSVACLGSLAVGALLAGMASASPSLVVHVWERQELTFTASQSWSNPYAQVTVWVDLRGPGFQKRIYGFWDGERTYRVRLLAPTPGAWTWQSGSTPPDS